MRVGLSGTERTPPPSSLCFGSFPLLQCRVRACWAGVLPAHSPGSTRCEEPWAQPVCAALSRCTQSTFSPNGTGSRLQHPQPPCPAPLSSSQDPAVGGLGVRSPREGWPDPQGPIPCHRATIEGTAVWARRFCLRLRKGEAVKWCSPRPPRAAWRCGSSFLNEGLLLVVHLQDPGCGERLCCAGTLLEMPAALRVSCCPRRCVV